MKRNYKNNKDIKIIKMLKSIVFLALILLVTSNHLQYEHERSSYSSKKSSPVVGFLLGIFLIILSLPMIWYN